MGDYYEGDPMGRVWEGDPALDPLLWQNAGANASISTTATVSTRSAVLGKVRLPRPMCIAVQISQATTGQIFANASSDLFATVRWQSTRGSHEAEVDIGKGTSFVVSAAEALEVIATMVSANTASVSLQSTMAPASALNPYAAQRTQRLVAAAGSVSPLTNIPAFARKLHIFASTDTQSASIDVQFFASGTQILDWTSNNDEPFILPPLIDQYRIQDTGAGVGIDAFCIWELSL